MVASVRSWPMKFPVAEVHVAEVDAAQVLGLVAGGAGELLQAQVVRAFKAWSR